MSEFYVTVPDNCTRKQIKEKLYSTENPVWSGNEILVDKMLFTIDLTISRMISTTFKNDFDIELTRLKSTYLHKQLGEAGNIPYTVVLKALIETDIFDFDPSYRAGNYCKSFGVKEWTGNKLVQEPLIDWKPSIRNRQKTKDIDPLIHEYKKNIRHVSFDTEYANDVIAYECNPGKKMYYSFYSQKLSSEVENDIYVKPDKNGRIHHNLCGASRTLRPAITVGGEPIHCIDISASQPYFAIKRILPYIKKKANTRDIDIALEKYPDVKAYIDKVTSGNFYISILDHLKLDVELLPDLKKKMLAPFFGSRDPKRLSKERKAIHTLYPTVDQFIKSLKNNDYKNASAVLQQTEREAMIDRVARRIIKEGKCKWFLTIHDSLLCLGEDIEYLKRILLEECTEFVGYAPKVKVDVWTTAPVDFSGGIDLFKETEREKKERTQRKVVKQIKRRRSKTVPIPAPLRKAA